jgi:HD superfamily phosphodiesterase
MTEAEVDKTTKWEIEDYSHRHIYQKAEPFLRIRHNAIHTLICYHFALKLLKEEGGNPDVVVPAILLHDVGYSRIPEDELHLALGPKMEKPELQKLHETEGAKLATEILESINYPKELIKEIRAIIDGHDTRDSALNTNDKIVKDADKLFRFSYEGSKLALRRFPLGPREWFNYLDEGLQTWFFTKTAKQLAAEEIRQRKEES